MCNRFSCIRSYYFIEHVKCADDLNEIVNEKEIPQLEGFTILHDDSQAVDTGQIARNQAQQCSVRVHE